MNSEELAEFRDSIHLPEDAGEYADRLETLLRRIPNGWGRWISHGKGWYKIICDADEMLAHIDPNYEVHQVKEKYGTLRYYFGTTYEYGSIEMKIMDTIVRNAEHLSSLTCEHCGAWQGMEETVKLQTDKYYIRTLCKTCAIEYGYNPVYEEDEED